MYMERKNMYLSCYACQCKESPMGSCEGQGDMPQIHQTALSSHPALILWGVLYFHHCIHTNAQTCYLQNVHEFAFNFAKNPELFPSRLLNFKRSKTISWSAE